MKSLEEWKNDTETHLGLQVEKKLLRWNTNLVLKYYHKMRSLLGLKKKWDEASRVSKIETENAQMKMEIKVTSVRILILATHPCFII